MKLGCMLINFNNGSGSRGWDCSNFKPTENPDPDDFLTLCFETYFNTISEDWPFVVVDDGSTDNSVEIIQRYRDRISHFVHNERNIGLTPSMEFAADILFEQGCDIICRFDGDIEFLTKGWDRRIIQHFVHNRRTAAVGGVQLTPYGGVWAAGDMVIHPNGYTHLLGHKGRDAMNLPLLYTGDCVIGDIDCDSVMGCLAAFRSSAYQRVDGLRTEFAQLRGETEDLNLRFLLEGYRCVCLGSVFFIHRHFESAGKKSVYDVGDMPKRSFAIWQKLWGFDKIKPDLKAIYERWEGTPLVRYLYKQPDGEVEYVGPQ
jgi:glycosyltransferase involved in cell wall biosynthesis